MIEPFKSIARFSWLGYLNFFLLQWLFLRLARSIDVNLDTEEERTEGFIFMIGTVPLTGWWSNYKLVWPNTHIWLWRVDKDNKIHFMEYEK